MSNTHAILDRFLDPFAECLTRDAAERIVSFRLDPQTEARLADLREKANEGQLTDEERSEYEEFVEASDLMGILQAKARTVLRQHAS